MTATAHATAAYVAIGRAAVPRDYDRSLDAPTGVIVRFVDQTTISAERPALFDQVARDHGLPVWHGAPTAGRRPADTCVFCSLPPWDSEDLQVGESVCVCNDDKWEGLAS